MEVSKEVERSCSVRMQSQKVQKTCMDEQGVNHILYCHVCTFLKYLQGWELYHFPGWPIPMLRHPINEEIFLNVQSKPVMM